MRRSVRCPAISRAKTGTASARPIQNRRVMSTSSGFGPASARRDSPARAPCRRSGRAPGRAAESAGASGRCRWRRAALRPASPAAGRGISPDWRRISRGSRRCRRHRSPRRGRLVLRGRRIDRHPAHRVLVLPHRIRPPWPWWAMRRGLGGEVTIRVGGEFRPAAVAAEVIGPPVVLEPISLRSPDRPTCRRPGPSPHGLFAFDQAHRVPRSATASCRLTGRRHRPSHRGKVKARLSQAGMEERR